MNDDYAPRPKPRCALPWVLAAVFAIMFLGMCVVAGRHQSDLNTAEDALATANLTIIKHEQMIDQQARIIQAWVDEHPPTDGELEPGAMGARFIPTAKDTNERLNNLVIRFEKIFDDVEAGRTGFHIKFSVMKGEADVTLRKQP